MPPIRAVVLSLLLAPFVLTACGTSAPGSRPQPSASEPVENPFRTPIPASPKVADGSAALVARIVRNGPLQANLYRFGTPVYQADAATPRRAVRCTEPWG